MNPLLIVGGALAALLAFDGKPKPKKRKPKPKPKGARPKRKGAAPAVRRKKRPAKRRYGIFSSKQAFDAAQKKAAATRRKNKRNGKPKKSRK